MNERPNRATSEDRTEVERRKATITCGGAIIGGGDLIEVREPDGPPMAWVKVWDDEPHRTRAVVDALLRGRTAEQAVVEAARVVYVVTEHTGEYSQQGFNVKAVFTTLAAADRYAEDMASLPGIPGEYGPGRENGYEVVEMPIWDSAPQRVMRYHIYEIAGPDRLVRARPPYRTEEFYPVGWDDDIRSGRDEGGTSGWCTISVTAASAEECISEYGRLLAEWRAALDRSLSTEGEARDGMG